MDQNQRIKEVFSDKEYVKRLIAMKSYEDAQKSLEEKDLDVSVEDLKQARNLIIRKAEGELTDDELEQVSGGEAGLLLAFFIIAALVEVCSVVTIVESAKDC